MRGAQVPNTWRTGVPLKAGASRIADARVGQPTITRPEVSMTPKGEVLIVMVPAPFVVVDGPGVEARSEPPVDAPAPPQAALQWGRGTPLSPGFLVVGREIGIRQALPISVSHAAPF